MKKLLFWMMSMMFLFTSCENYEIVDHGELTAINEKSAQINGINYCTENGTTDFILGNKITVDKEPAYIYMKDENFYVSKAVQDDINALESKRTTNVNSALVLQGIFLLLGIMVLIPAHVNKREDNLKTVKIIGAAACGLAFIPGTYLFLGKCFPEALSDLNFTQQHIEFMDYGELTKIQSKTKTINSNAWSISSDKAINTQEKLARFKKYSVISINGKKELFEGRNPKVLRAEIHYINQKDYSTQEVIIALLSLIGFSGGLYFLTIDKKKRIRSRSSGIVSEDEKNGHSVEE